MPDCRRAADTTVLQATLPLATPTETKEHLTSWRERGQGYVVREAGGSAAVSRVATVVALTPTETAIWRVIAELLDNMPSLTPAKAITLTVDALALATAPLRDAALRTLGE